MSKIELPLRRVPRQWNTYKYRNPRDDLVKFGVVEDRVAGQVMPEEVRTLRVPSLRRTNYLRQAALFTYGMSCATQHAIEFALVEDEDFDFITRWMEDDTVNYRPVQLKELVPEHLNSVTFEEEMEKLFKYSPGTTVAVYVNR